MKEAHNDEHPLAVAEVLGGVGCPADDMKNQQQN